MLLFIDSYFTEKYLGIPSKHLQEYDNADLTLKTGSFNERHFMLIHGTADTKVTAQHPLLLAKALIEQEVLFQQIVSFINDDSLKISTCILLTNMFKQIFLI